MNTSAKQNEASEHQKGAYQFDRVFAAKSKTKDQDELYTAYKDQPISKYLHIAIFHKHRIEQYCLLLVKKNLYDRS